MVVLTLRSLSVAFDLQVQDVQEKMAELKAQISGGEDDEVARAMKDMEPSASVSGGSDHTAMTCSFGGPSLLGRMTQSSKTGSISRVKPGDT